MPSGTHPRTLKPLLLIPFATLLVLHPLLIHGPTCGQDLAFHLQSWLDAAQQLRHGTLYPHWDITAAWNAGEPRFLFYPPISWMPGAILTFIFPAALCPTIFIAIALLLSGFTFHKLASEFASPNAALIASTLYLANPYMLFTAFERSALAELLAAAWIPLLLLALLRPLPTDLPSALRTIRNIAIPLALLWLTNAPAAVIGSYTLALVATLRVLQALFTSRAMPSRPERAMRSVETRNPLDPHISQTPATSTPATSTPATSIRATSTPATSTPATSTPATSTPATIRYPKASALGSPSEEKLGFSPRGMPLRLATTYLAGALLGLTLPALYLLPAAYERRYVQTAMALLPNMRYQDNFLFTSTTDPAHNAVNHTISLLALVLLLLTAAALLTVLRKTSRTAPQSEILSPTPPPLAENSRVPQVPSLGPGIAEPLTLTYTLALLTLLIAFLLTPISSPIWRHLPNLAYLQFPWRLLILLTPILALAIALLLDSRNKMGAPSVRAFADGWDAKAHGSTAATALTLLLPLAVAIPAYRLYHQPCDPTDDPTHLAQLFATHHGFSPTDEYTPTQADNDPLRSNNPAYWLAASPNDPAPNTTPTAAELNPTLDTDDTPIPDTQTLSTPAPHHFQIHVSKPSYLILNLRDYPNWHIAISPNPSLPTQNFQENSRRPRRTDGLIAIALNHTGDYTLDIAWHRTLDQQLGLALTLLSLLTLAFTYARTKATSSTCPPSRHPERSEGPR